MGNQGFQGEARGPAGSVIRRKERNTAATSNLYATQQVRDNENLHHIGKPAEGYRYHTQRNLTHAPTGAICACEAPSSSTYILGGCCYDALLAFQYILRI